MKWESFHPEGKCKSSFKCDPDVGSFFAFVIVVAAIVKILTGVQLGIWGL